MNKVALVSYKKWLLTETAAVKRRSCAWVYWESAALQTLSLGSQTSYEPRQYNSYADSEFLMLEEFEIKDLPLELEKISIKLNVEETRGSASTLGLTRCGSRSRIHSSMVIMKSENSESTQTRLLLARIHAYDTRPTGCPPPLPPPPPPRILREDKLRRLDCLDPTKCDRKSFEQDDASSSNGQHSVSG